MALIHAYIIAITIGFLAGYVGSLMVSKKMALAGGALGHLTIPGMTLALLYNFDLSLGAISFLIVGVIIIWFLERKTKISMEALTAVVFSSSLAVAFLFLEERNIMPLLIGDVSKLNWTITLIVVSVATISFLAAKTIYNKIMIMNISEDLAKSMNIDIDKYNLIFLFIVAFAVALGVRIVGGLMTAAILSIPATTSRTISKNLRTYSYGSATIGMVAGIVGVLLYSAFSIPIGSAIIISNIVFFITAVVFSK